MSRLTTPLISAGTGGKRGHVGWVPRRFMLPLVAIVGFGLPAASLGQTSTPPTLMGETLAADPDPGASGGTFAITGQCNPTGTSTASFTASGPAVGPYPGRFTETGSFSFGPLDPEGVGRLQSFEASFTIVSGETTVTGTKAPTTDPFYSQFFHLSKASCSPSSGTQPAFLIGTSGVGYEARIDTPAGSFGDRGPQVDTIANTGVLNPATGVPFYGDASFFGARFQYSYGVLEPLAPTSECLDEDDDPDSTDDDTDSCDGDDGDDDGDGDDDS